MKKTYIDGILTTEIDGRAYRAGALTFYPGSYDIIILGGYVDGKRQPVRIRKTGRVTEYNGTLYGITKEFKCYTITHIPTGMVCSPIHPDTIEEAAVAIIKAEDMLQRLPDKLTQLEAGRNRMQNAPRA